MSQPITVKGPAIVSNSAGSDIVPAGTTTTYDLYTMGPLTVASSLDGASGDNGPAPTRPHK